MNTRDFIHMINKCVDFFWPLLPSWQPQMFPEAKEGEIETSVGVKAVYDLVEKAYHEEFDRMRVIESKASMFIGTTTFMATFVIGISTFLAKGQTIGLFIMVLSFLAFCICLFMTRVLYLSIKALERSVIFLVNPIDFYKAKDRQAFRKEAICQFINATNQNHNPINKKMNYVIAAQRYFKRVLFTLGLYALVLLFYTVCHYDDNSGSPLIKAIKAVNDFKPEPWLIIIIFGISTFAIMSVVLSCLFAPSVSQSVPNDR